MIKNKKVLSVLNYFGKIADKRFLLPVNFLIAVIYKNILIQTMNIVTGQKVKFIARHSVTKSSEFNFAYSDLDLSAVVEITAEDEIQKIKNMHTSFKRFVPSLGEIEIYSQDEKLRLDVLLEQFGPEYETLRAFRKVWWMQHARDQATSDYHKQKAERSIKACLQKIDKSIQYSAFDNVSAVSPFLQKYINNTFPQKNFLNSSLSNSTNNFVHCPYMGVRIYIGEQSQNKESFNLESEAALKLLSITPVAYNGFSDVEKIIQSLRKEPEVFQLWAALTEIEVLIFAAFLRGLDKKEPWTEKWRDSLEKAHFAVKISAKVNLKK